MEDVDVSRAEIQLLRGHLSAATTLLERPLASSATWVRVRALTLLGRVRVAERDGVSAARTFDEAVLAANAGAVEREGVAAAVHAAAIGHGSVPELRRTLERHGTRIPPWIRIEALAVIGARALDPGTTAAARRLADALVTGAPPRRREAMKKAYPLYAELLRLPAGA